MKMREAPEYIPEDEPTLVIVDFINGRSIQIADVIKRNGFDGGMSFWNKHEAKTVVYTRNVACITYLPG